MDYLIKPNDRKTFVLIQEEKQLGTLEYDSSLTQECATIRLNGELNSRIQNTNIWKSEFLTKKAEATIFQNKQNWNGDIDLTVLSDEPNKKYTLKTKSIWKDTQVLVDENKNEILVMSTKYNWKNWSYDFFFTCAESFSSIGNKELMLFTLMQGLKKKRMSVAVFIILIVVISANHN